MPVLTQRHTAEIPKPILAKLVKKIFTSEHSLSSYHFSQQDSLQSRLEAKWEKDVYNVSTN
jgi:hypothetical protein